MSANDTNHRLGCQLQGDAWSANYGDHVNWCRAADQARADAEALARRAGLDRCRACIDYAETAIARQDENIAAQCGYPGPRWSGDFGHHFRWCMSEEPQRSEAETHLRTCELHSCRQGEPDFFQRVLASAVQADVVADYTYPVTRERTETVSLPVPGGDASLRQVFDDAWAALGPDVCERRRGSIEHSAWHDCTPGTSTELYLRLEAQNVLALTYIVRGTRLRFDATTDTVAGSWADPTIDVSFDVTLYVALQFASRLFPSTSDPALLRRSVTLRGADACVTNASVNSANAFVSEQRLRDEEDKLRREVTEFDLEPQVRRMNDLLNAAAAALPRMGANDPVLLQVGSDGMNVLLHFERKGGLRAVISDTVQLESKLRTYLNP